MADISLLGATGSVGTLTLEVMRRFPNRFRLCAASAHTNVAKLAEIARVFCPQLIAIGDETLYKTLKDAVGDLPVDVAAGSQGLRQVAAIQADVTVCAMMGFSGLGPALEAARLGRTIALANKECLVAAGPLFLEAVQRGQARLLPLDSEHNALFQLLGGHAYLNPHVLKHVAHITLTASGGPLWCTHDLENVTVAQTLTHPVWPMGAKISVDSATMVNKALELVEACYLFDQDEANVRIVVHPQAQVHAMVHYKSGVTHLNQSVPDMRVSIAHALFWPQPAECVGHNKDDGGDSAMSLYFETPDDARFPAIPLVRGLLRERNPLLITAFNAANEVAVRLFLENRIRFLDIIPSIHRALETVSYHVTDNCTLEGVLAIDKQAREVVEVYHA